MTWTRYVVRMRETKNAYKILVGRPVGNRLLGRPRACGHIGSKIKLNLEELGCQDVDWTYLVQNKVQWQAIMNTEMNLRVP
jgi:hypothetical protein